MKFHNPPLHNDDWPKNFLYGTIYSAANILFSLGYVLLLFNTGIPIKNIDALDTFFEGTSVLLALFMFVTIAFVNLDKRIKVPFLAGLLLFQNGRATDAIDEIISLEIPIWSTFGDGITLAGEMLIVYAATKWIMQAYYLSMTDKLTHLYNRHFLEQAFEKLLFLRGRGIPDIALIMLDLDDFKKINDNYGHGIGDDVLKCIAHILKRNTRKTDIVARYGGEEFEILLPNTDLDTAKVFAERLRYALASHSQSLIPSFTASIGVAVYQKGDGIKHLRKRADNAVYEAKRQGKNQVAVTLDDKIHPLSIDVITDIHSKHFETHC